MINHIITNRTKWPLAVCYARMVQPAQIPGFEPRLEAFTNR